MLVKAILWCYSCIWMWLCLYVDIIMELYILLYVHKGFQCNLAWFWKKCPFVNVFHNFTCIFPYLYMFFMLIHILSIPTFMLVQATEEIQGHFQGRREFVPKLLVNPQVRGWCHFSKFSILQCLRQWLLSYLLRPYCMSYMGHIGIVQGLCLQIYEIPNRWLCVR